MTVWLVRIKSWVVSDIKCMITEIKSFEQRWCNTSPLPPLLQDSTPQSSLLCAATHGHQQADLNVYLGKSPQSSPYQHHFPLPKASKHGQKRDRELINKNTSKVRSAWSTPPQLGVRSGRLETKVVTAEEDIRFSYQHVLAN